MSFYHFSNELEKYYDTLHNLITEMLDNKNEASLVLSNAYSNINFSSIFLNESHKIEKLLYQKIVNFTIDHINKTEPQFFTKSEFVIKNYLNLIFNKELNKLNSKFNKSLISQQHFYKRNYSQIADYLNVDRSDIQKLITLQSIKLFDFLELPISNCLNKKDVLETRKKEEAIIRKILLNKDENLKSELTNKYEKSVIIFIDNIIQDKIECLKLTKITFNRFFDALSLIPENQDVTEIIYNIALNVAIEYKNGQISKEKSNSSLDKLNLAIEYYDKTLEAKTSNLEFYLVSEKAKCIAVENYYELFTKNTLNILADKYSSYLSMKYLYLLPAFEISGFIGNSIYYVRAQIIKAERLALTKISKF